MHPFLDKLGIRPIFSRNLTKKTCPFCSLEWAVKAIAGEVMIPYNASANMTTKEIMGTFGVSEAAANIRIKH